MRVTWTRYQFLACRRDATFGRWTGTTTYGACVAFFLNASSRVVRVPAPYICASNRLTVQRVSDDVVEVTVDLAVGHGRGAALEDLYNITWDVCSGRAVARGIRVTHADGAASGEAAGGHEVSAAASDACSSRQTNVEVAEWPPAHVSALFDGARHDVYVSCTTGGVIVPGEKAASEAVATAAPVACAGDAETTEAAVVWQQSESLRLRKRHVEDLLPMLKAKGRNFQEIVDKVRDRVPVEAPRYWPGDTNCIQMYTGNPQSVSLSTLIGVNLFGPVNPSHDMLIPMKDNDFNEWAPQLKRPAGSEISLLPPLRTILNMAYSCLRLPRLTEDELTLRKALARGVESSSGVATRLCKPHPASQIPIYIRTRASATATTPCVNNTRYMIDCDIPSSMTVRFLDILTPGKWQLHLDDEVIPCVSGRVDLGVYARPDRDWSMKTGGRPDVNGISFGRRDLVYLTFDEPADHPRPPCVRFMVRGTVIVAVKDDTRSPLVGFAYGCNMLVVNHVPLLT
jgi:hypothetical protein